MVAVVTMNQRSLAQVDRGFLERLIVGGAVLGGGGGGSMADGRRMADLALARGTPTLAAIGDLSDTAVVATVSAVGAPAAIDRHVDPGDFVEADTVLVALE